MNFKQYLFFCRPQKLQKKFIITLIVFTMSVFLLPSPAFATAINNESIINLTNKIRIKNNVPPLSANQLLTKAAYEKANAIIKAQTFSHNIGGKKFSIWIRNAGYDYSFVGENLAIGFLNAETTMSAWLKSPSHRKNILNSRFKEIGVAVIKDKFNGKNEILVVQIFGEPRITNIHLTKNIDKNQINVQREKQKKELDQTYSFLYLGATTPSHMDWINTDHSLQIKYQQKNYKYKNMQTISFFNNQVLPIVQLFFTKTKFSFSSSPISIHQYYFIVLFGLLVSFVWIIYVLLNFQNLKNANNKDNK